jgi:hypothetical protein
MIFVAWWKANPPLWTSRAKTDCVPFTWRADGTHRGGRQVLGRAQSILDPDPGPERTVASANGMRLELISGCRAVFGIAVPKCRTGALSTRLAASTQCMPQERLPRSD